MRVQHPFWQGLTCVILMVITGATYLVYCFLALNWARQLYENDLSTASSWLQEALLLPVGYPAALLPFLADLFIAPLCNAVFWGILVAVFYGRHINRQSA